MGLIQTPAEFAEEQRQRHLILILGTNGMGKSWLMCRLMAEWSKANPGGNIHGIQKRGLYGGKWIRGAGQGNPTPLYPFIKDYTNDGMGPSPTGHNRLVGMDGAFIFLDDYDGWAPENIMQTPLYDLFTEHRHQRLDICVTAHRPQNISKVIIGAAHYIYLFNMNEPYALKYLSGLEELRNGQLEAMQQPKTKGQCIEIIKDPDNPAATRARYRNFLKQAA